ncbi:MAG: NAD(P)-dependent oxidoreductase [Pseudomonadota bacterium]
MTASIALIGAGAMGNAIGTRLLETGQRLHVFDIDPDKVAALVALGATAADTAAAAAAASEAVILSLNTAGIVERAVFDTAGVATGARPGTVIIDMSSIAPEATRTLATRARENGFDWVDSPLSGGAPKALIGELTLMLGGDSEPVERARAVLSHVAKNITHMGPAGAGQTTKLINQVLCALGFVAVAEATKLAEDAGINAAKVPEALAGGRADSALLQEYMPRYSERDYRPTGRIDNMVKDLGGALDVANAVGTSLPLTAMVAELHKLMVRAGYGDADQATLMEYYAGFGRDTAG